MSRVVQLQKLPLTLTLSPEYRGEGTRRRGTHPSWLALSMRSADGTMKHITSLRDHVDWLRTFGEAQDISVEVDWTLEMGAIIRRSYELKAPAPLFHRIRGIEPGFRVLG